EVCARARLIQPDAIRILITAYADLHAAISAINDGQISRYMTKPWQNAELSEILRTAIEFVHLNESVREMEVRLLGVGQTRIANALAEKLLHEVRHQLTPTSINMAGSAQLIQRLDVEGPDL